MKGNQTRAGLLPRALRSLGLLLCLPLGCLGADWPQYRGSTTDGITPEAIATTWLTTSPGFVVWTNSSLTNGFSSFVVSQGRAFTEISMIDESGTNEYCVAVDAATGTNIWTAVIGDGPWDPGSTSPVTGAAGTPPCNTGDGPRGTPAVEGGNVLVLSARMVLVSLNWTNGAINWTKDLVALYGASEPGGGPDYNYNNAAAPRLGNGLIFVNLNTATDTNPLCAFSTTNGSRVWASTNNETRSLTHCTPVVATILGTRQVLFATVTGIVSLDCNTGIQLWKYTYPWGKIDGYMCASPVAYSNLVFCTALSKGSAVVRVTFTNNVWTASQLWTHAYPATSYQNTWMTPVIYQGYIYGQFGTTTYVASPLNCIELATGNVMWSTNNFGMGGTILVNNYLLTLTEDGQLVLSVPNPSAYTELARFRAFQFTADTPGKCWNSPAYSNGRIYARSTTGAISVNVAPAVAPRPQLMLFPPSPLSSTQMRLTVGTTNGTPIDSSRVPGIEVRATNRLGGSPLTWPQLTNPLALTADGLVTLTNFVDGAQTQLFFITIEQP